MKSRLEASTHNWFMELIMGIIFIAVGIWVFNTPLASYVTLSILFAFTFLVTGIMELAFAITTRKYMEGWGWSLAGGVLDTLIGLLLVSTPSITMTILPIYVGFAVLFRSFMAIGLAVELNKQEVKNWAVLLFIGILGVLFAFVMLLNPVFAGLTIVAYTAMAFLTIGIFQIYFSFRLRKIKSKIKANQLTGVESY